MLLPKFYVSKDIPSRGISRLGTINLSYNKIIKVFGAPTASEASGDNFDGSETVSWKIKFENGYVGEITDNNSFGEKDDYRACNSWNVFGHDAQVLQYIKAYLDR